MIGLAAGEPDFDTPAPIVEVRVLAAAKFNTLRAFHDSGFHFNLTHIFRKLIAVSEPLKKQNNWVLDQNLRLRSQARNC